MNQREIFLKNRLKELLDNSTIQNSSNFSYTKDDHLYQSGNYQSDEPSYNLEGSVHNFYLGPENDDEC